MIKYFIYELKKDIPTLLFTALLLIILIGGVPYNTKFEGLAVGSGLLIAAYILFLVYRCINLLTDDLFSNKRLFIFSLPISKLNIVIGKYLYACVYIAIMIISMLLSAVLIYFRAKEVEMFGQNILEGVFSTFSSCLLIYSFIYLTMAIGKILFNSKSKAIILTTFCCVIGIIVEINTITYLFAEYVDSLEIFFNITNYVSVFNLILSFVFTIIAGVLLNKFLDV